MSASAESLFGSVIYSYTRAQALEDGVLVAVPEEMQKNAGFKWPIALTREAWEKCVAWSGLDTAHTGVPQDEAGRLWDVVWMLKFGMRSAKGSQCTFSLQVVDRTLFAAGDNIESGKWNVKLKAICGPGDTALPVITIMMPWED